MELRMRWEVRHQLDAASISATRHYGVRIWLRSVSKLRPPLCDSLAHPPRRDLPHFGTDEILGATTPPRAIGDKDHSRSQQSIVLRGLASSCGDGGAAEKGIDLQKLRARVDATPGASSSSGFEFEVLAG